jgi:hypothetical protein
MRGMLIRILCFILRTDDEDEAYRAWYWIKGSVVLFVMLGIIVGGLNAIYLLWGMAAFWVAVFGTFMFLLWLQNRTSSYGSADDAAFLLGNAPLPSQPPPPGKPQLPPSGHTADRSGKHGYRAEPSRARRAPIEAGNAPPVGTIDKEKGRTHDAPSRTYHDVASHQ